MKNDTLDDKLAQLRIIGANHPQAKWAAEKIERLLAALKPFADAPSHGIHGGPMTTAILVYEDGTDEDSARHHGRLSPPDFERASAAFNSTN